MRDIRDLRFKKWIDEIGWEEAYEKKYKVSPWDDRGVESVAGNNRDLIERLTWENKLLIEILYNNGVISAEEVGYLIGCPLVQDDT